MAVNNSRRFRVAEPSSSLPDKFKITLTQWNPEFTEVLWEGVESAKTMGQAVKIKGDFEANHFTNVGNIQSV